MASSRLKEETSHLKEGGEGERGGDRSEERGARSERTGEEERGAREARTAFRERRELQEKQEKKLRERSAQVSLCPPLPQSTRSPPAQSFGQEEMLSVVGEQASEDRSVVRQQKHCTPQRGVW